MASRPIGPGSAAPPPEWGSSSPMHTRNQMVALMRATLIALALAGILVLIVWL